MKHLQKTLLDCFSKKVRRGTYTSREPTAAQIRAHQLEFYSNSTLSYFRSCPERFEQLEKDREYILKAYHIMTNEEVLASHERENSLSHEEISKFLRNHKKEQEEAHKPKKHQRYATANAA